MKILIVEDNDDLRLLLKTILRKENYEILEASDGAEAFASLAINCPDLILLDLTLPDMDGSEFMTKLRSLPSCSHVKAIIVSGRDALPQRVREIGAAGYVRKPVDLDTLLREIDRHI